MLTTSNLLLILTRGLSLGTCSLTICFVRQTTCRPSVLCATLKKLRRSGLLKCTRCQKEKHPEEMSVDKKRNSGLSSWCKQCRARTAKNWAAKNPERYREQQSHKKPQEYLAQRDYMLRYRYGISLAEYETMLEAQNRSCAICKKPASKLTYLLHVDHCHDHGHVRGLLCSGCNLYVGYVKNNPEVFANGSEYLKRHNNED